MIKLTLLWVATLLISIPAFATYIESVQSGSWDTPATWSTNSVPGPKDEIVVKHTVVRAGPIVLNSGGIIDVRNGGSLETSSSLTNNATIINSGHMLIEITLTNYGSITNNAFATMTAHSSLENYGTVLNDGKFNILGNLENYAGAVFTNNGKVNLIGDLENAGTFNNDGVVDILGDLENIGTSYGNGGLYAVCGDVTNQSTGNIVNLNYLCQSCGSYMNFGTGDYVINCFPFPVTLISFEADLYRSDWVKLRWQTAMEHNTDYFEVMRYEMPLTAACLLDECAPDDEFVSVGRVTAAGNSNDVVLYEFMDMEPGSGILFYKLKTVDLDGAISWSPVVELFVNPTEPNLVVYPNPASDILNVKLSGTIGDEAMIRIYDLAGHIVYMREIEHEDGDIHLTINANRFAAGAYIVNCASKGKVAKRKLIVTR